MDEPPNQSYTSPSSRPSPPASPPAAQFLHYGDIIQLFTSKPTETTSPGVKLDLNEKTFLVDYIDDDKVRLVDVTSFDVLLLNLDDEGNLRDSSIQRIELLTRAKEPGYARQKGLVPDQWVDIYFIGVEQPMTAKITHLEEDQIELTLHPSQDIIYIDFSYRGLPEELGIERFVLRSSPAATAAPAPAAEDADVPSSPPPSATPTMEYTPDNEVILSFPETIEYDSNIRELLQEQYLEADELFFGKDRNIVEQFVEQEQYEMVFNIETQLTSLMNELLSQVPNAQRTHDVMGGVHRLLDRFRELRDMYSIVDPYTQQVQGVRTLGNKYKPMVEHWGSDPRAFTARPLSWWVPVTQTRRKIYYLPDEDAGDFPETGDTVMVAHDLDALKDVFKDYKNDAMHGVVNPYRHWLEGVDPFFHPVDDAPLTTYDDVVPRKSVLFVPTVTHDTWESVVNNAIGGRDFSAYAATSSARHTTLKPTTFFVQRFNDATMYPERSDDNRRVFHPRRMGAGETMSIESWLAMPTAVGQFSRVHLPTLDMMRRAEWAHAHWLKYRTLTPAAAAAVNAFVVDDLDANYYATLGRGVQQRGLLTTGFMKGIQHYVLDPTLAESPSQDTYRSFLNSVVPTTFDLVELVQDTWSVYQGVSVRDYLDAMEPFLVTLDQIPYVAFNRIRYFIGKRTHAYKEAFYQRRDAYRTLEKKYERLISPSHMTDMMDANLARQLLNKGALYEIFADAYRVFHVATDRPWVPMSGSEIWQTMLRKDYAGLFALLLRNATLHHVVAESFLKAIRPMDDAADADDARAHTPKGGVCDRLVLTKRYTSLADLQKDNHQEAVYYDPELDDTPYGLLDAYKGDMPPKGEAADSPAMTEFLDVLAVNLIQKHGIAKEAAAELAKTLVAKKKQVREGQYAMLDVYPQTAEGEVLSVPDREFYKRIKNKWVRDTSVQEESFAHLMYLIDAAFPAKRGAVNAQAAKRLNQALCNGQPACYSNPQTATCDTADTAERRIQQIRQQYAVQEMESRLNLSQEELTKQMEMWILQASRSLVAKERLRTVVEQKYSLFAYALGQEIATSEEPAPVQSPYTKLRNDILGQDDFSKRQYDVVRFYQTGALRRAMVDELGEDDHWLYCTDTNTKLLPAFLYDLAKAYVDRGEAGYQALLEELTQFQMLSDDGDAIVDKHSGYIMTKIEWVNEELYDEHGFKKKTSSALIIPPEESDQEPWERPAALAGPEAPTLSAESDTEVHRMVKNIFVTFCQAADIPPKEYEKGDLRVFVMRTTLELFDALVKSKDAFLEEYPSLKGAANAAAKYKTYWHQYVIVLTMAVLLIGIQTSQPAIRTKKTVPGCVKSFTGYPWTESAEDTSGIQYLTCILQLVKSSIPPWNSVKAIKKEAIQEMLRKILERILESRKDIHELYVKQRAYREEHPEEFVIPEPYQLQTWRHLLPPMVNIGILDRLPRERPSDDGTLLQLQSRAIQYGYGVLETVNQVVRVKEVLLKTSVGVPFIQNACCNASADKETTLQYFMRESPELALFLRHMEAYQARLEAVQQRAKAATLLFMDDTRPAPIPVTSGPAEELIYAAFIHFCHFDRADAEIPEHLQSVCTSKPAAERYNPRGTLAERIQALKHMGRKYDWDEYDQLVRRVNGSRRVTHDMQFASPTAVSLLTEFLASDRPAPPTSATSPTASLLDPFRAELLQVLVKYDPQVMLLEHSPDAAGPDSMYAALDALVNVLGPLNERMRARIEAAIPKGSPRDAAIRMLHDWTSSVPDQDGLLKNASVFLVKVLPAMIDNNQFHKEWRIPKHWNMGTKHQEVIETFMNKNREWFAKFAQPDPAFKQACQEWQAALMDVVRFIQLLPLQAPLVKEDGAGGKKTFFRLFSPAALQEITRFVAYALFDQVVVIAQRLPKTQGGTKTKQTMMQWMIAMMEMIKSDQKIVNMSYQDIMKEVEKSRTKEKARIMRSFQEANESDRRYMYMEKVFKLNRWSVNAKDLLKENDAVFEKEVAEFVDEEVEERFGDYDPDYDQEDAEPEYDEDAHHEDMDDNEGDEDEYDEGDREDYEYEHEND